MCAGNYAEEILAADARGRPGFLLDKGGSFAASTTARDAFTPDGKTGEALAANARRDDIFCERAGIHMCGCTWAASKHTCLAELLGAHNRAAGRLPACTAGAGRAADLPTSIASKLTSALPRPSACAALLQSSTSSTGAPR